MLSIKRPDCERNDTTERADNPRRDRALETVRIADGDRDLSHAQRIGITERYGSRSGASMRTTAMSVSDRQR